MKSPKAKAFDLVVVLTRTSKEQKSRAFRPLRGRVHFFDERQRNGTKENALCPRQIREVVVAGIFREGILPSSKNAAHPCAAPSGSANIRTWSISLEADSNSNSNSNRAITPATDGWRGNAPGVTGTTKLRPVRPARSTQPARQAWPEWPAQTA